MRPIHISLGPNYEKDDVLLALRTLFSPWKWFDRKEVELLEKEFCEVFDQGDSYQALAINSGRSAQYVILKSLDIGKGDEVAIQAFTCVAVPNAVSWTDATPVFVDIDKTLNMDALDLKHKLSLRTAAVVVQNTFGVGHKLNGVLQKKHTLIEDCAHSLGDYWFDSQLGTLGDISFFSFGRDKVISSVFGGMIFSPKHNWQLSERVKKERESLPNASLLWTIQQLLHPIFLSLVLPTYSSGIGKVLLVMLQKIGLLSRAIYEEEKQGKHPDIFPAKMPPALAVLARHQLNKLGRYAEKRKEIGQYYLKNLAVEGVSLPESHLDRKGEHWLRFPIQVDNPKDLIVYAKKRGIVLGDWYKEVIAPCPDPTVVGYEWGSCPNAEHAARHIVNLPTYPTMTLKDAEKVVQTVKKWLNTQ